jgi:hypothetical protein
MKCGTRPSINDPSIAEALVAWAAVEVIQQMDLRRIILEGDALEVVQALNREEGNWRNYG